MADPTSVFLVPPVPGLDTRRVTADMLWHALEGPLRSPWLTVDDIGRSAQDRPLRTITFGQGSTELLLWSQMHGDEATATRALADLVGFFAAREEVDLHRRLRQHLRITMLLMLNPDGAQAHQRETADGIDINRDAVRLASPEAQALAAVRERLQPAFGFNLHDQDVRRRAGPDGDQVAFSFLAPPVDIHDTWAPVRARAHQLVATMAAAALDALPNRVARWSEEYEPRAFGECFQRAGTSTVLVETGALRDDPDKERLRTHLAALLLTTFDRLADGSWEQTDPAVYTGLPLNHPVLHDLHLTGGTTVVGGRETQADVALLFDDPVAHQAPRLAELGDLGQATALERVDCTGRWVVIEPLDKLPPGMVAPEDRVHIEIRKDGPEGPIAAEY
ncbi:MAG: M14 family zinc carboxypeptidase [Gemmatimonadetes bacterium]|nr:M14 family zinc carboxypeptidase [Gemmatimonadota bacterium]